MAANDDELPVAAVQSDDGEAAPVPTADSVVEAHAELLRKKQVLAALVVHDLRNPLSALSGNLELLREELEGVPHPAMIDSIVADCLELTAHTISFVADILDVEELEEGVLHAEIADVVLTTSARRAAMNHGQTLRMRDVRYEIDVEENLVGRFDAELCHRVFENLLDNAVRYAKRGGRVVFHARRDEDDLVIEVKNDGPAIPESELNRVFERYYRIDARRAGARANRGLGLYFCRLAVEAHGGTITLGHTDEFGAVFTIRLPQ